MPTATRPLPAAIRRQATPKRRERRLFPPGKKLSTAAAGNDRRQPLLFLSTQHFILSTRFMASIAAAHLPAIAAIGGMTGVASYKPTAKKADH